MNKLFASLWSRLDRGFTLPQKILITAGVFLYVIFPIDLIPDLIPILGWLDDGFVIGLLIRVWRGPTLPGGGAGSSVIDTRASVIAEVGEVQVRS